jgi:hypothetical protein
MIISPLPQEYTADFLIVTYMHGGIHNNPLRDSNIKEYGTINFNRCRGEKYFIYWKQSNHKHASPTKPN